MEQKTGFESLITIPGLVLPSVLLCFMVWILSGSGRIPWGLIMFSVIPVVLGVCTAILDSSGKMTSVRRKTLLILFTIDSLIISLLFCWVATFFFGSVNTMLLNFLGVNNPIVAALLLIGVGALTPLSFLPVMPLFRHDNSFPAGCCISWMQIYMILAGSTTLILAVMRMMVY